MRHFWFFILLLFPLLLSAQIEKQSNTSQDSVKVSPEHQKVINLISESRRLRHQDKTAKAIRKVKEAIAFSDQYGFTLGTIKARNTLGLIYTDREERRKALKEFEKALSMSSAAGEEKIMVAILNNIGRTYKQQGKYDEAIREFERAKLLNMSLDDERMRFRKAKLEFNLGSTYSIIGNLGVALDYYRTAIGLLRSQPNSADPRLKISIFNNTAKIFAERGEYSLALGYYGEALNILKKYPNKTYVKRTMAHIADIYNRLGDYEEAQKITIEALKKKKNKIDLEDRKTFMQLQMALGDAYLHLGQPALALQMFNMAEENALILKDRKTNAKLQNFFAKTRMATEKYDMAFERCDTAFSLAGKIGDRSIQAEALLIKGDVRRMENRPQAALRHYQSSYAMADSLHINPAKLVALKSISETYNQLNMYKESTEALNLYIRIGSDSLAAVKIREIEELKMRFKNEALKDEIQKIEQELGEAQEQTSETEKSRANQLSWFIALGFMMFVIVFLLFYSYRTAQKKNNELAVQQEEIETQNEQLTYANQDLKQFAYVVSHDLKEPLRMIKSYSSLMGKMYTDKIDEDGQLFLHYMGDGVERMENLLGDLLKYATVGIKEKNTLIQWVNLNEVIETVKQNLAKRIEENKATVSYPRMPTIYTNQSQMIQLFQNLIGNAIKFRGERAPEVTVDFQIQEKGYQFSVSDNGIGIPPEHIDRVFQVFQRLHSRDEYEGTGIGLAIVQRIVYRHGGKIWVESEVGTGTSFIFTLMHQ